MRTQNAPVALGLGLRGLAAVGNTSPQPALRWARVCNGVSPEKQVGMVWLVIESQIIVAWLHLAARTVRGKKHNLLIIPQS